ncbi:MAG: phosphoribosylformylglycinamidine synthase subunit PurS [Halanaerobiaceae bacterium]
MRWKVEARVNLKKGILDPQGSTVENALHSMGYEEVENVRIGKDITFYIEGEVRQEVEKKVDEMCHRVLSNPVIENYEFQVKKAE